MTDPSPSNGALQSSRPSLPHPAHALRASRGSRGRHARGWLRHYAGLFTPSGTTATRLSLERDAGARGRRLAATIADRGWGGARSRPRMRALAAAPGARLHWREVAAPALPGPYGAVVHPIAASTCDMDCPVMLGATPIALPLHLGHECVAEVLSIGERVRSVRPGDRVIVPFQINCGECRPAVTGTRAAVRASPPCRCTASVVATGHWGGAFSDQLAVPYADAMLVPLPDGIDPAAAASVADNVCDAYRHIGPHLPALLSRDPDAEILVLSATSPRSLFTPSCPLYTGLIARALGARHVYFADRRPRVRALAERLGMHPLDPRELRRRGPFPLVADVSVAGLGDALASTAPDGICSSSGGLHRGARIPFLQMYIRNATLHVGRTHVRALIPKVLELMSSGALQPESVTTTVASLDDAPGILREHFLGGESIKVVLTA